MVQQVVQAIIESLRSVGGTLMRLAPQLAILVGAVLIGFILLWAVDRAGFRERLTALREGIKPSSRWLAFGLLAGVIWLTLQALPTIVAYEDVQQQQVQYTSQEDPSISGVFQYGPLAAYIQERTYSRTMTLPPGFLERIGSEGVQVLSPYMQDPSAENVLKLADTFRRSGQDVVFTREVTKLEEVPISIAKGSVDVKMTFKETGTATKRSYYDAQFNASYTFSNPLPSAAKCRFRFALPQAGTIREFELSVDGKLVGQPTERGDYEWEGELPAGGTATASVRYVTQGGGSWKYEVGSGRRRIEAFTLKVSSNEPARFLRGALYPTSRQGNELTWELKNVITNQQVDLYFPGRGVALESKAKALDFLPIALLAFLLGAWLTSIRWSQPLYPTPFTLATLGFGIGLGALTIATFYVPLFWAVLISGAIGTTLAVRTLGTRFLPATGVAAVLPLAFVSEIHSGLIVLIAAILVFVALAPKIKREAGGPS